MVIERGPAMSRSAAACVKRYLESISRQPRRGVSAGPIQQQLEAVEERLATTTDRLTRVHLHQQSLDLQAKLASVQSREGDFEQIEEEFIASVAEWADGRGVTYEALRRAGVEARVLRRAGMSP